MLTKEIFVIWYLLSIHRNTYTVYNMKWGISIVKLCCRIYINREHTLTSMNVKKVDNRDKGTT